MDTVYALTRKTTGPTGHGEPGAPHLTLATDGESYDLGNPIPFFTTSCLAEEFKSENSKFSSYEVTPIKLSSKEPSSNEPVIQKTIDSLVGDFLVAGETGIIEGQIVDRPISMHSIIETANRTGNKLLSGQVKKSINVLLIGPWDIKDLNEHRIESFTSSELTVNLHILPHINKEGVNFGDMHLSEVHEALLLVLKEHHIEYIIFNKLESFCDHRYDTAAARWKSAVNLVSSLNRCGIPSLFCSKSKMDEIEIKSFSEHMLFHERLS